MENIFLSLFIISIASFCAAFLTLFSGFGLGTLLMPVVALFFTLPVAVALTAFVHLTNNLFKLALLKKKVDWHIVFKFGLPAFLATIPGAYLLTSMAELPELFSYEIFSFNASVTGIKITIGLLLIIFATLELLPLLNKLSLSKKHLIWGGVLSGFFGGLSGHQGAFRSAFLIKAGLDKNSFVASNSAIAALIDIVRLVVYGLSIDIFSQNINPSLLGLSTVSALLGSLLGIFILKKITIKTIQNIVAVFLYGIGSLLMAGLI